MEKLSDVGESTGHVKVLIESDPSELVSNFISFESGKVERTSKSKTSAVDSGDAGSVDLVQL